MTKNQNASKAGESIAVALQPDPHGLLSSERVPLRLPANTAQRSVDTSPIVDLANRSTQSLVRASAPHDCRQTLWLSFFFDGTGNNLDADVGLDKHSNVAKLYRAHIDDDAATGIYRIYIPGLGTYFGEIGDPGGTALGLGVGKYGEERLDWALSQLDRLILPHVKRAANPTNAIDAMCVSVFGFSRGAALARAFVNKLLNERCRVSKTESKWLFTNGGFPVRVRFMGLFDTVASVGTPMSMNNTSVVGAAVSNVSLCIRYRLTDGDLEDVRPVNLAFARGGSPGADPATGSCDGHQSWGGRLRVPEMVEEVRHFVAAHECRNSFPLDSLSVFERGRIDRRPNFFETVYPGVHSDVGGSYCPGEGGRGSSGADKLGLIPLAHMYAHAISAGVPLRPRTTWGKPHRDDFAVEEAVRASYNYYMNQVEPSSTIGSLMNSHMKLYFAWRFQAIRVRGDGKGSEFAHIEESRALFGSEARAQRVVVAKLEEANRAAREEIKEHQKRKINDYQVAVMRTAETKSGGEIELRQYQAEQKAAEDRWLKAKAKLDAVPNMETFGAMLQMYDRQLLADVKDIREALENGERSKQGIAQRRNLRPHYRILLDAYENEFVLKKGLSDPRIIAFFDNYVHDSLAGFAKDATLPSDPRVVYVGGDVKLDYAHDERTGDSEEKLFLS